MRGHAAPLTVSQISLPCPHPHPPCTQWVLVFTDRPWQPREGQPVTGGGPGASPVGPGPWLPALSSRVGPSATGHPALPCVTCPSRLLSSAGHPGPHGFSRLIPHILQGRSQSPRVQKADRSGAVRENPPCGTVRGWILSGRPWDVQPSPCPEFQKHERMHRIASLGCVPPTCSGATNDSHLPLRMDHPPYALA